MIKTDDMEIVKIWQWTRSAYLRIANRKIKMPDGTDPRKTYQWRYLTKLRERFEESAIFEEDQRKKYVITIVQYAKDNNLLHKGLSIFSQNNLFDQCRYLMGTQRSKDDGVLDVLRTTREWIEQQVAGKCDNLLTLMFKKCNIGAYRNIVKWYLAGSLPDVFLAMSKTCAMALVKLEREQPDERKLLPSNARLFLLRSTLTKTIKANEVRQALRSEWRPTCQ